MPSGSILVGLVVCAFADKEKMKLATTVNAIKLLNMEIIILHQFNEVK